MYIVSITSQGQISIPAKIRKELGFNQHKKAVVTTEKGKMVIEPVSDFMSLKGVLHKYAKKGKSLDELAVTELDENGKEKFLMDLEWYTTKVFNNTIKLVCNVLDSYKVN